MLTSTVQAGDCVWVVKVSKRRRLYPHRLPVLDADTRRVCVASGGRRLTWPPDFPNLFSTRREALQALSGYHARLKRRRAAASSTHRPARAA